MTYTVNMPSMHPNIFLQQNVIQLATYVTGFMKTSPNRTRTEIHFIA